MSANPCLQLEDKEVYFRLLKIYELKCKQEANFETKLAQIMKLMETSSMLVKLLDDSNESE